MVRYPRQARVVGGAAVLALLLQLMLVPPLALRMLALDAPVCGETVPAPGKMLHDHAQCLLCQGHAVPLGLMVAGLAIIVSVAVLAAARQLPTSICVQWYSSGYRARAPPALC